MTDREIITSIGINKEQISTVNKNVNNLIQVITGLKRSMNTLENRTTTITSSVTADAIQAATQAATQAAAAIVTTFADTQPPSRIVLPGLFNQLFSSGSGGVGYDYMEWVSNATPSGIMPTMIFPFACRLTQITCRYLGTSPFQCSSGDSWVVKLYKVSPGSSPTLTNATIGDELFTWNNTLDGTFPSTMVTLDTPLEIQVGDEIAIVGVEEWFTAPLQQDTAEAQLCLVFEY